MKKSIITIMSCLCLVFGCATTPPPKDCQCKQCPDKNIIVGVEYKGEYIPVYLDAGSFDVEDGTWIPFKQFLGLESKEDVDKWLKEIPEGMEVK